MARYKSSQEISYITSQARGSSTDDGSLAGIIKGDDGNYYIAAHTTGIGGLRVISLADGTMQTARNTELTNDVGQGIYTFTNRFMGGAVGDGVHGFVLGQDLTGSFSSRWGIGYYKINSAGNLVKAASGLYRSNSLGSEDNPPESNAKVAGLVNGYFIILATDGTAVRSICLDGPSAGDVSYDSGLIGSSWPWDARVVTVSSASWLEAGHLGGNANRVVNGAGWFADNEFYSILTKGDVAYEVANPGQAAPSDLINTTTYVDGAIIKFTSAITNNADGVPSFGITGYSVDNSNWSGFPWSDQSLRSDGTTTDHGDDYQRYAASIPVGGNYVVTFLKIFDADAGAGGDLDPTGTRFTVRAYLGNSGGWNEIAEISGLAYDVVSDAGVGSSSRYSSALYPRTAAAVWHPDGQGVYIIEEKGSTAPTPLTNDYVVSRFGTLFRKKAGVILNVN